MIAGLDVLPLLGKGIPLPSWARCHAATPPGGIWRAALTACPVAVGVLEVTVLQRATGVRGLLLRHGRIAALLLVSSVEVDLGCWAVVPVQRSVAARVSGGVSVAHFDGVWRNGNVLVMFVSRLRDVATREVQGTFSLGR